MGLAATIVAARLSVLPAGLSLQRRRRSRFRRTIRRRACVRSVALLFRRHGTLLRFRLGRCIDRHGMRCIAATVVTSLAAPLLVATVAAMFGSSARRHGAVVRLRASDLAPHRRRARRSTELLLHPRMTIRHAAAMLGLVLPDVHHRHRTRAIVERMHIDDADAALRPIAGAEEKSVTDDDADAPAETDVTGTPVVTGPRMPIHRAIRRPPPRT